jgi:hypothetical protein
MDLTRDFPDSRVSTGPGHLTWIGKLTPTPLSDTYTVQIDYAGYRRPVISVLDPPLVAPEGKGLKHVFQGRHPCVHFDGDWDPSMSIAAMIIPWTSEWLLHYEIYRATGRWTGGGHEPGPRQRPTTRDPGEGGIRSRRRRDRGGC